MILDIIFLFLDKEKNYIHISRAKGWMSSQHLIKGYAHPIELSTNQPDQMENNKSSPIPKIESLDLIRFIFEVPKRHFHTLKDSYVSLMPNAPKTTCGNKIAFSFPTKKPPKAGRHS